MSTMDTLSSSAADPKLLDRSLFEADLQPSSMGRMLPVLWAFIALACAYDVYLSIEYAWCLRRLERNPIGSWLLHLDGGNPALFMGVKVFSNLLVLSLLIKLHRWYVRLCWALTAPIALFQLWLMAFLTFA